MRSSVVVWVLAGCFCTALAAQESGSQREPRDDQQNRGGREELRRQDVAPQLDPRIAVPTPLIDDLEERRSRDPAARDRLVLGIVVQPVSDQLATHLGIGRGFYIASVLDGSPAAAAGLRPGDVVVRAAGKDIEEVPQLNELVDQHAGQMLQLVIVREGREQALEVQLDAPEDADREGEPRDVGQPAISELLDELVESKLREMAAEIESEIGRAQMQRLRELARRITGESESRRRAAETTPQRDPEPDSEPEEESLRELRDDLRRLRQEVEEIRNMLQDLQQPANAS